MIVLLGIVTLILGILVCGIILIQQPRTSGLGIAFGVPVQLLGIRESIQVIEKWTVYLIAGFLLVVVVMSSRGLYVKQEEGRLEKVIEAAPPVLPPPVQPVQQGQQ